MKRRLLALTITGLMAFGGTAAVSSADPGPNGNNDGGLCTAYFNGQKKGHDNENAGNKKKDDKGRQPGEAPPPFQGLEEAAEAADQSVFEFCMDMIGGNPDNGRFPECFDNNEDTGNDACPSDGDEA